MIRRSCHMSLLPALIVSLMTICGSGCATHANRLASVQDAFYAGKLDTARSRLDKQIKRHKSDADVLRLEHALVDLVDGRPKEAEQTLRVVRDQFDFLEQKDVGESILSTVTDDNRLAYAGEDYEKILIRCFLSLSNLMHHGGDASAYALQVGEKQRQIIDRGVDRDGSNPKLAYKRVALGAYIHAAIQEATHVNYDEAAVDSAGCQLGTAVRFRQRRLEASHRGPAFSEGQRCRLRVRTGRSRPLQGRKS